MRYSNIEGRDSEGDVEILGRMSLVVPVVGPVTGLRADERDISVRRVPGVMGVLGDGGIETRVGRPRGG